jgi:dynein heavy chain
LKEWQQYIKSDDIYHEPFPKGLEELTNPFYRLLLIKIFRQEKIMHSFSYYVSENMGKVYDEIASSSMEDVFNDSNCQTPIIFILSVGADPTSLLLKLGSEKN